MSKFIVVDNKLEVKSQKDFLLDNNYYKSYSLFLAYINDVAILDTLILTSPNSVEVLEEYMEYFSYPIMLRMDYAKSSTNKYIGGIPIYSPSTLKKICLFLFRNGYIPVLQTYANRFENINSFNCILLNNEDELYIEFAGEGFDAGDLRLGLINSHERIKYDCTNWEMLSREIISEDEYLYTKLKRELYTGKMEAYIKYANNENKLLNDINILKEENGKKLNDEYSPMTKSIIEEAAYLSYVIKMKVIPFLPFSQEYIASFSMLEDKKYVLWDIYGKWYCR